MCALTIQAGHLLISEKEPDDFPFRADWVARAASGARGNIGRSQMHGQTWKPRTNSDKNTCNVFSTSCNAAARNSGPVTTRPTCMHFHAGICDYGYYKLQRSQRGSQGTTQVKTHIVRTYSGAHTLGEPERTRASVACQLAHSEGHAHTSSSTSTGLANNRSASRRRRAR